MRKHTQPILVLLFLPVLAIFAQDYGFKEVPLWDKGPIPYNRTEITLEEYIDSTGRRIRQISEPRLYIYSRSGLRGKGPTMLYLPGGGYSVVALKDRGESSARYFLESGFDVVAFLVYRLPDAHIVEEQHRVPLCDAQKALSLMHRNARRWHIDPQRIAVMGSSAGGHLAASLANLSGEPVAPGVNSSELEHALSILLYPVISFNEPWRHKGSYRYLLGEDQEDQELLDFYSMENRAGSHTPPTLLIHATDDASVPWQNSLIYREALEEAGVPCAYIELSKGGHGFGFNLKRVDRNWLPEMEEWIRTNMNMKPSKKK